MNTAEIRATVLRVLGRIAPEIKTAELQPDVGLREQVDLDSMDFLSFVIGVGKELGVEIPESDYAQLDSIDHCVAYLAARHSA
ncbi:MAG TPA: acyl carrier protein [Longimicrobiales bacterium]|nr:acyl carrier protein [Longimicrobiales bacterium]